MIGLEFKIKGKRHIIQAEKGDDLLLALDKFLESTKIRFNTIKGFKLLTDTSLPLTSNQISQIITKVLNWSISK